MLPAVGRPWLVTPRSTIKSTIPVRTKIIPIVGGITIIPAEPYSKSTSMRMKVASSL